MGVEFKYLSREDEDMISLSDNDFNILFPYFEKLNNKVGIFINEYSDSKLSPDHIKILLNFLKKDIKHLTKYPNIKNLIDLLIRASANKIWIEITGD